MYIKFAFDKMVIIHCMKYLQFMLQGFVSGLYEKVPLVFWNYKILQVKNCTDNSLG